MSGSTCSIGRGTRAFGAERRGSGARDIRQPVRPAVTTPALDTAMMAAVRAPVHGFHPIDGTTGPHAAPEALGVHLDDVVVRLPALRAQPPVVAHPTASGGKHVGQAVSRVASPVGAPRPW